MANVTFGRLLLIGAACALAACQQGAGNGNIVGPATPDLSGNATARGGDVEAPDVFQVNEAGLWDGRPSLGGIWVAHPDVVDPERVLIRNTASGKSTIGALFRRERENPGPALQISSDAASELGILAGQPTTLSVVALRRQELEIPELPEPAAGEPADATPDGAAPEDGAAAVAAAAVVAVEESADGAPGVPLAEPVAVPETRSPSSFGRRAPPPAAAAVVVDGTTEGGADAALPADATLSPDATVAVPEPVAVPEDAPPTSFGRRQQRTAPAPVVVGGPDAPVEGVTTGDISVAPLDAAGAPAAVAPAPAAATIRFPFIQAASFGTEANAQAAVDKLVAGGVSALTSRTPSGDKVVWRVLAGPVGSAEEQEAVLEKVKSMGFRDAYLVRG